MIGGKIIRGMHVIQWRWSSHLDTQRSQQQTTMVSALILIADGTEEMELYAFAPETAYRCRPLDNRALLARFPMTLSSGRE